MPIQEIPPPEIESDVTEITEVKAEPSSLQPIVQTISVPEPMLALVRDTAAAREPTLVQSLSWRTAAALHVPAPAAPVEAQSAPLSEIRGKLREPTLSQSL